MEYVAGGDCLSFIRTYGKFSEPVATVYIAQIAVAIKTLHDLGVIHRDIKCDNILITARGHVKLGDFGLVTYRKKMDLSYSANYQSPSSQKAPNALLQLNISPPQQIGDNSQLNTPMSSSRTDSSAQSAESEASVSYRHDDSSDLYFVPVGNPFYSSPEVVIGAGYDHTIDWWALGVLFFHMLSGKTPFERKDISPSKLEKNIQDINIKWDFLPPNTSSLAKAFLSKCLRSAKTRHQGNKVLDSKLFYNINFSTLFEGQGPLKLQFESPIDTRYFTAFTETEALTMPLLWTREPYKGEKSDGDSFALEPPCRSNELEFKSFFSEFVHKSINF